MPFAGGKRRVIARGAHDYNVGEGVASTAWSHDSKLVATTEVGSRLVVRDLTTGVSRTRKVFDNADLGAPSFSPSGRRVAYSQLLDVSGYLGWVTTRGPRRGATLAFRKGGERMGTNPVWGLRGIAMWEFDGDRYDVGSLHSFVFVSDSTGRHGHRLPGSSDDCVPVAWVGPDVLLAGRFDAANREHPVYLGINRPAVAALPDSYSRIAALAADHQSFIALDGDAIVRVSLTTGSRQLLGHGTNPSSSG